MGVLESLSNLLGYSVPTILVIAGVALLILPFFKDMPKGRAILARLMGTVLGIIGIALVLLIKPSEPQQFIPLYVLPTPGSNDPSTVESDSVIPNANITAVAMATTTLITGSEEPSSTIASPTEPLHTPTLVVPTATLPAATSTPELVTSIIPIWGMEENGVRVEVPTAGVYEVSYFGDAYSAWPNEQAEGYRGWTTIVRIYANRPVEWGLTDYGLTGPINEDAYLGPGGYYMDKTEAISSATGDSRTLRLQAGDYLTLVSLDQKGRYFDNQGKVDVGITYLGQ